MAGREPPEDHWSGDRFPCHSLLDHPARRVRSCLSSARVRSASRRATRRTDDRCAGIAAKTEAVLRRNQRIAEDGQASGRRDVRVRQGHSSRVPAAGDWRCACPEPGWHAESGAQLRKQGVYGGAAGASVNPRGAASPGNRSRAKGRAQSRSQSSRRDRARNSRCSSRRSRKTRPARNLRRPFSSRNNSLRLLSLRDISRKLASPASGATSPIAGVPR